jgi:molybdate transport system regulatory protein
VNEERRTRKIIEDQAGDVTLRLHLWLEENGAMYFGLGRCMLLKKIEELGSLRKAAMDLGISYRAAWGKIKATEDLIGLALVTKSGAKGHSYSLTDFGGQLVELYGRLYRDVEAFAIERARKIFSDEVKSFKETYEEQEALE